MYMLQVRTGLLPTRWGVTHMWTPAWGRPSCRPPPSQGMGRGASVSLGQQLRVVGHSATATEIRLFTLPSLASSQMPTGLLLSPPPNHTPPPLPPLPPPITSSSHHHQNSSPSGPLMLVSSWKYCQCWLLCNSMVPLLVMICSSAKTFRSARCIL